MKATQKQIADVTAIANEMNVPVANALSSLNACSISIYQAIGAKGVVEAAAKTAMRNDANSNGGILLSDCSILGMSEKAFLILIPNTNTEKWIAKSIIKIVNGNSIIPFWAVKN